MGGTGWYKLTGTLTGVASSKNYGVHVKAGKTVYIDEVHLQVGTGANQTMYVMNGNTGVTGLNVQGLVNGTLNGVATYTKAGTISDADFADAAVDGLIGFDSTDGRLYIRNGGSWSYIAKTAGFQIPENEAFVYNNTSKSFDTSQPLQNGDFLIPFVEKHLSDNGLHGLYTSFNSVKGFLFASEDSQIASLSAQITNLTNSINLTNSTSPTNLTDLTISTLTANGAVTFKSTATFQGNSVFNALAEFFNNVIFHNDVTFIGKAKFNKDTAGQAIISTYSNEVDVKFSTAYETTPIININLVIPDPKDTTFIENGQKAYLTNITTNGFSIVLPTLALRDFTYNWLATAVDGGASVTKSASVVQQILDSITPTATPSPTLTLTPTSTPTPIPTEVPVASASPMLTPTP
jgi:hypothetical protein